MNDWTIYHPILLQRPIVAGGARALIARPPKKVHGLMDRPATASRGA